MIWLKWLGSGIGVLVAVAIGAAAYESSRWGEGTRALRARLEAARTPPSPPRYEARELDGLPAPVQRYFRAVLKDGQPIRRHKHGAVRNRLYSQKESRAHRCTENAGEVFACAAPKKLTSQERQRRYRRQFCQLRLCFLRRRCYRWNP